MKFLRILAINFVCIIFVSIIISTYVGGALFGMSMAPFAIILFVPPTLTVINTIMFLLAKFHYKIFDETTIYGGFALFWGVITVFFH